MTDDDYDELFRTAYPRLVAMGMALSTERHISQELAQETLLRAYHHRNELDGYDSPLAWCRRVMGNLLIDQHRSRTAERSAIDRMQARAVPSSASGASCTDPAQLIATERWHDLVASLTAQQRLVATLYYAEDQSVGAVAQTLDITAGTVKSALAKARLNLRRSLGRSNDDTTDSEARS